MASREDCIATQRNNIEGTLNLIHAVSCINPKIHIIKLGTMGEYGTPNIDIEEGWIDLVHNGRKDRVLYPKKPGSWYHLSKVHDSHNLEFACRVHKLRVTDLNQGVVYGTNTKYASFALGDISFHYDHVFGTVLNRFLVQAMKDMPMTVYGNGSQKRGFLNIRDTMKCVVLAAENPADRGEFRVFNQFTEQFSVLDLANAVKDAWGGRGIEHIENPRVEQEDHYYNAKHTGLAKLGLAPILLTNKVIRDMAGDLMVYLYRVDKDVIDPTVKWK
jgi:UDP-sulfoquinovose synthase